MKKKLILSTEGFPFGKGEKPLIQPELEVLSKVFDVTIVSHTTPQAVHDIENKSKLSDDIKVVNIDMQFGLFCKILYSISFFLSGDGWKEIFSILRKRQNIVLCLYQSMGFYALAMHNWRKLRKTGVIDKDTETIYYSYWYFYYTYSMTKHKQKYPNVRIVTRTHGFDLYDERYSGGRQPFKKIMDNHLDRIFFVCENAKGYYEKKHQENSHKYVVSRMGTAMPGEKRSVHKTDGFLLISCSNVIPLKRLPLIIDALGLWNENGINIEWYHFGDGDEMEKVQKYAEKVLKYKDNVSFCFQGFTVNEQVMKFYQNNEVDCFINVSETEGCPVSIQEAMSYGIPVIGTDVGGVSELIKGNGILLSANPSAAEVHDAINKIASLSVEESQYLREKSFQIWEEEYQAEKNARNLAQLLESL